MRISRKLLAAAVSAICMASAGLSAVPRKAHSVVLGAARKVAYSKAGDPGGAATGEDSLRIRALVVDAVVKEWTTGDAHDVTDRSFVVRRAIRLNDALPNDKWDFNTATWGSNLPGASWGLHFSSVKVPPPVTHT